MRVLTSGKKIGPEVPMSFFNFDRFEGMGGDFFFIDSRINFDGLPEIQAREKKIVYLEIEEPNRFGSEDPAFRREKWEQSFYHIFSVCPYTTEWLNRLQGKERRTFVFFPFDKSLAPAITPKVYDVIYFGGLHSPEITKMVKVMSKFNYRFVAPNEEKNYALSNRIRILLKIKKRLGIKAQERYLTDKDVTHAEKLALIAKTKVTIVHNMLYQDVLAALQIQKTPDFKGNEAFRLIPERNILRIVWDFVRRKGYIVPQQKTRLFEAALGRSLILCRKDPFNVIERFFDPGKEFIYYEPDKLEETLRDVLANYGSYKEVIERAHQRVVREYSTQAFFEKFLKNLN